MKIFRILWIVIELIIAIAIFIILAQKTPLFDRVIPWRDKSFIWETNNSIISNNRKDNTNTWSTSWIIPSSSNTIINKKPSFTDTIIIESPSGQSCYTPRWTSLSENQSVTAYLSNLSDTANTCIAELRVCRQWRLSWSYRYQTCSITVEGKRNGKDIIKWASNSSQQFVNEAVSVQQRLISNKEFIQPKATPSKWLTAIDIEGRPMENSKLNTYDTTTVDVLDQTTLQHDHDTISTGSCTAPWWEEVKHWTFVYAYDQTTSDISTLCHLEKRSCINWKLSGTFTQKTCNEWVSQNNSNSDTIQSTAWIENNRLWNQVTVSNNNGILSPWWPIKPRSIPSAVQDIDFIRYYNNQTSVSIGSNDNNTQNYIEFASCVSPRWTALLHGQKVTAYRTSQSTWNSLCDVETRTCRDGILWWSYTYQSCNPNPVEVTSTNNNRRYPGKRINKAVKQTRYRLTDLF
jgi:hypothetical protein